MTELGLCTTCEWFDAVVALGNEYLCGACATIAEARMRKAAQERWEEAEQQRVLAMTYITSEDLELYDE